MTRRLSIPILCLLVACGGTSTSGGGAEEGGGGERIDLTDDPARARAFQAPLDIFVQPLDQGIAEVISGVDPNEAFNDVVIEGAESFSGLEAPGRERLEIGELEIVIVAVKDRGPPDSQRWEQTTLEVTAVRAGGVFRLTALHSDLRRLAEAPDELGEVPDAFSELRDTLLESFAGPSCRFLPRLREADLSGLFDEEAIAALAGGMPDQERIDRTCADWWDRTPSHRRLEIRRVAVHRVDADRRVIARYTAGLGTDGTTMTFGPIRED